ITEGHPPLLTEDHCLIEDGLRRINKDIAIDEHYCGRPGSTLSCRSSRCHLTGSVLAAKVLRAASFSRRAAMAGPRACASETGACSTTVTSTRSGASAWDSGASPSHSSRSPCRRALYVRIGIYLIPSVTTRCSSVEEPQSHRGHDIDTV